MLHVVASRVNKRTGGRCSGEDCRGTRTLMSVTDSGPFLDERLPKFWEEYIKNPDVPAVTRKHALTAWLWV
jgi:hypothetical protein